MSLVNACPSVHLARDLGDEDNNESFPALTFLNPDWKKASADEMSPVSKLFCETAGVRGVRGKGRVVGGGGWRRNAKERLSVGY